MKRTLQTIRNTISQGMGIALILVFTTCNIASAQNINDYTFSATSGTYTPLAASTLLWGNNATSYDDDVIPAMPIGFDFWMNGVRYTHLTPCINGWVRLGQNSSISNGNPTTLSSAFTNAIENTANTQLLCPFWDDLYIFGGTGQKIHYAMLGTAPNRELVIEWNVARITTGEPQNFQARISESSNLIKYSYGNSVNFAASASVGFTDNIGGASHYLSANALTTAAVVSSTTATNTLSIVAPNGLLFTFTPPPVPAAPTALSFAAVTTSSMTLNWVDNATNESSYLVFRSDDNGVFYNQVGNLAANATTYNATGLIPGKTFYWRVVAVNAGGPSANLLGNQTTLASTLFVSTGAGGNWSSTSTWVPGVLPGVNDSVVIVPGATVTIDGTAGTCFNLTVNGTLIYDVTTAATLSVLNNVKVSSGGIFNAGTGALTTHNLRIGGTAPTNLGSGSLVVEGGFDMNTATAGVTVTFFGTGSAVVSGSGSINFRAITLNKGAVAHNAGAPTLDIQTAFTVQGANTVGLVGTHTAGILKISGSYTQANPVYSAVAYTTPLNGGLWINNPNFTVVAQNGNPTVNGLLRITNGIYNIGTTDAAVLGFGTGAMFTVDGGTVNASARITSGNVMTFNMSSGTINVAIVGNSTSNSPSFGITNNGSTINVSGGTLNLVQRNTGATILDYNVSGLLGTTTGGVVNVGTPATATNFDFRMQGGAYNVVLDNTGTPKKLTLSGGLSVLNSLTIPVGDSLLLNNQTLQVARDIVNDGHISGKGSGVLQFNGALAQQYSGTGAPDSLFRIVNSNTNGGVTFSKNVCAQSVFFLDTTRLLGSANLTLGNTNLPVTLQYGQAGGTKTVGNFDVAPTLNLGTGSYSISYLQEASARTTSIEVPASRIIRSLTINNTNGVTISGGALNLEVGGVLTLTNGRVNTTSTNILNVQDSIVGSVSGGSATAYVNGPMTRQLPASLIVQRTYSFPVGKNSTYGLLDLVNPGTNAGGPVTVKVERFNAPTGGTLGAGTASIDTMFWRVELTSGATNIDSTNIRLNGTGLTGISRILYSPTLTGAYTPASLGPISSTQIRTPNTLMTSANIDGYFAFGTQIIPLTGTYLVGASQSAPNYHNLTEVVADLNYKQLQGNVTFELQADYTSATEIFPLVFNNPAKNNVNHTVTIRPAAGATDSIVGSFNGPLLRLDGIRGFTLEGRQGGTGAPKNLIVRNNNTGASAAAVTFVNDAVRDTLKYVVLWGASTTATSGVVNFGTGLVTGNDSNAVMNSDIGGDTITSPATLIQALGSTDVIGKFNDYIVVSGCNLYNFWNTTAEANAFKVSNGNNNWTITNNSIYQMSIAGRTSSSGYYSFNLNGGNLNALNNTTITNNYIGGSEPMCGGTPWKQNSSGAILLSYFNLGNLMMSNVKNNTFANIDIVSTSTSTTGSGTFNAIQFVGGMMNIDSNTIGSMSGLNSIRIRAGSAGIALPISAISSNTAGTYSISGNKIGGITIDGGGATSNNLQCITITSAGSNMRFNINGNIIGNTLSDNIVATNSSSTTAQNIRGIHNTSAATLMITNNTIHNLTNQQTALATASIVSGITSTAGVDTIMFNTVDSLNSIVPSTGTGVSASVIGISLTSTTGNALVTRNTIYALKNTSTTGAVWVTGINYGGGANDVITRNMVHSLTTASTSVTSQHNGINYTAGTALVANNMVRLGVDETGAAIIVNPIIAGVNKTGGNIHMYYNSVYVGGTGIGTGVANTYGLLKTAAANDTIADNVIVNSRSNATTGGSHYAVRLNSSANSRTNYNLYHADGTGSFIGNFNGTNAPAIGDWIIASAQDANSISGNPGYLNPTGATPNLHVSGATLIEGIGSSTLSTRVASVTDDYDGDNRATNTPVDVGADGGLFTPLDLSAPAINFTLLGNDTVRTTLVLTNYFGISDISGVANTGVNAPRIYFKKKTDNNAFLGNTSADNGWKYTSITNLTSPYSMTIDFSIINGGSINIGDTIQYFVVAQDLATVPNIGAVPSTGFAGTSVSAVSSAPTTPAFFAILPFPLAGNYTIGTSVPANFASITEAVNALNTLGVKAPVTFTLIDASYTSPAEIFPITISAFKGASGVNTLTIKPDATVTSTITGSSASSIINLNGADFVTIDGSNNGSSSRNLTIANTNTGTSSAVIWGSTTGSNDAVTKCTIKNSNIIGNGRATTLCGIGFGGTAISLTSLGNQNNDNSIINCVINNAQMGIYSFGNTATNKNKRNFIDGNEISILSKVGIYLGFEDSIKVSSNSVKNILQTGNTVYGLSLGTLTGNVAAPAGSEVTNALIEKNKIDSIVTTAGWSAHGVMVVPVANGGINTLRNNMVSRILGGATPNDFVAAIYIGGGNTATRIYYNTVYMTGAHTTSRQNFALAIGGSDPVVDIRNNILINNTTGGTVSSYAIGFNYSTFSNLTCNYNNYTNYATGAQFAVTGTLFGGTNATSLAALQAATGKDANSSSDSTIFISTSDLHLAGTTLGNLLYTGTPIVGITTDIDGDTRVAGYPYMGADESTTNPLPVTLSSFTATVRLKDANLSWTTVSETNNRGFEIERSIDGRTFAKVDFVKGAGNSNRAVNYAYTDVNVFSKATVLYYRLKQIDMDGKFTYSQIVRVAVDAKEVNALSVYPNPFTTDYTVSFTANHEGTATIQLFDLQGKMVSNQVMDVTQGFNAIPVNNVEELHTGIYFMKATMNGETQVIKLVKN